MTASYDSMRIAAILPKFFEASHPGLKMHMVDADARPDRHQPLTGSVYETDADAMDDDAHKIPKTKTYEFSMLLKAGQPIPDKFRAAFDRAVTEELIIGGTSKVTITHLDPIDPAWLLDTQTPHERHTKTPVQYQRLNVIVDAENLEAFADICHDALTSTPDQQQNTAQAAAPATRGITVPTATYTQAVAATTPGTLHR